MVRTICAYRYAPGGEDGILHSYREAIARAERFIYIENQYLWSPRITESLIAAVTRERSGPFQVAVVLPVRPNIGKTDTDRNVRRLLGADAGRGRVHVYGLYTWGRSGRGGPLVYKPIYVHSKLMIVDDAWLTIGSANLNTRSLASDAELNVLVRDEAVARGLRLRLWSEHLLQPEAGLAAQDPVEALAQVWPGLSQAGDRGLRERRGPLPSRLVTYPLGIVLSGIVRQ